MEIELSMCIIVFVSLEMINLLFDPIPFLFLTALVSPILPTPVIVSTILPSPVIVATLLLLPPGRGVAPGDGGAHVLDPRAGWPHEGPCAGGGVSTHLPGHLGRDHPGLGGHQGLAHTARPLVAALLGNLHWGGDRDIGALLHRDVDALLALHLTHDTHWTHDTHETWHP